MVAGCVKQPEGSRLSGPDTSLEEFKARLPLVEIIGRYVKLSRRGREHLGLCPFHKEKTPSFNVVEDKGFFHCFGCGAHGTAIDFVMAIENLSFADALSRLAELTGMPAPRRTVQSQAQAESGQRLYAANAAASVWFQAQLAGATGREAMAYLERRGLDRVTIRTFELGYAPNEGQGLSQALKGQGFSDHELIAAGAGQGRRRRRALRPFPPSADVPDCRRARPDRRLRRPGARRRPRQYLNTPETEVFHKGELLTTCTAQSPARDRRSSSWPKATWT